MAIFCCILLFARHAVVQWDVLFLLTKRTSNILYAIPCTEDFKFHSIFTAQQRDVLETSSKHRHCSDNILSQIPAVHRETHRRMYTETPAYNPGNKIKCNKQTLRNHFEGFGAQTRLTKNEGASIKFDHFLELLVISLSIDSLCLSDSTPGSVFYWRLQLL